METNDLEEDRSEENWADSLLMPSGDPAPEQVKPETEADEEADGEEIEAGAEADAEDDAPEAEDTPENDEDEDAGQEQPDLITVKVDGKEMRVTLEDLKRSYSSDAYSTQRRQEAAALLKEAEATRKALMAEQERVLAFAQQIQRQGVVPQPVPPDPSKAEKDPAAYTRDFARYQAQLTAWQQQQYQLQSIATQTAQQREAERVAMIQEQAAMLPDYIPEFKAPETARQLRAKLVETGMNAYGYSTEELEGITDARAVRVLHDAMKWREAQAKVSQAKKAPEKPKSVKPAGRRSEPPQLQQAKLVERAKRSDNVDDWVASLLVQK